MIVAQMQTSVADASNDPRAGTIIVYVKRNTHLITVAPAEDHQKVRSFEWVIVTQLHESTLSSVCESTVVVIIGEECGLVVSRTASPEYQRKQETD
jgi:hypothetical protein